MTLKSGLMRSPAGKALRRYGIVRDSRDFLFRILPQRSVGVEIGVWKGDFSARLLGRMSPSQLHLVDPWAFVVDERYKDSWYGGSIAKSQADMDQIYEDVVSSFSQEIEQGRVVVHRQPSVEAAHVFPDRSVDWVYIDGDHTYEAVVADLDAYASKIRPGGFLVGDDYGEGGWWEGGVMRAVDSFAAGHSEWEVQLVHNRQFVLRSLP